MALAERDTATIWWVRHGPTHAKAMVGWSDIPADLSDRDAIARLSGFLPTEAAVVSSDLLRARDTASALQGRRMRLPDHEDLRELHFGSWEMRTHAEIESEEPALIRAFWDSTGDVRAPEGESWNDMRHRVARAVEELLQPGAQLIVVAHFGVILSQLQSAMGWTTQEAFGQKIDNLSVTVIDYGAAPRAHLVNHLPGDTRRASFR